MKGKDQITIDKKSVKKLMADSAEGWTNALAAYIQNGGNYEGAMDTLKKLKNLRDDSYANIKGAKCLYDAYTKLSTFNGSKKTDIWKTIRQQMSEALSLALNDWLKYKTRWTKLNGQNEYFGHISLRIEKEWDSLKPKIDDINKSTQIQK